MPVEKWNFNCSSIREGGGDFNSLEKIFKELF